MAAMICDLARVAPKDSIFFYLQKEDRIAGQFFGEFQAVNTVYGVDDGFVVGTERLTKNLPLRVPIEARTVFKCGLSEDQILDRLTHPETGKALESNRLLWTLIYRKLAGNRGCVAIRDEEAELLRAGLRAIPGQVEVVGSAFNVQQDVEMTISAESAPSNGEPELTSQQLNLWPLYVLAGKGHQKREVFLQWRLIHDIVNRTPAIATLVGDAQVTWLANEVRCGVGNRSIDLLLQVVDQTTRQRKLIIIELKDEPLRNDSSMQVYKYVQWAIDHYVLSGDVDSVEPVMIATQRPRRSVGVTSRPLTPSFKRGSTDFAPRIAPLRTLVVDAEHVGSTTFLVET
jgi:hypothetical protein